MRTILSTQMLLRSACLLVLTLAGCRSRDFLSVAHATPAPRHNGSTAAVAATESDAGAETSTDASIDAAAVTTQQNDGGSASVCPSDMVRVHGNYCIEVDQDCEQWSEDERRRCLRFRNPSRCVSQRRPMDFCMDRFEWPNRAGALPEVMVTWLEAEELCARRGRRLCTQDEWTFACEGEQMLPYPYGYERDSTACTVDHFARAPNRALLHSTRPGVALAEAQRVYEAAPSGTATRCASPFGAMDLVGSVDEWTVNETGVPFRSALKGGWWGRIRGRCRPATLAHYERFRYYQIGFRCCASLATNTAGSAGAR